MVLAFQRTEVYPLLSFLRKLNLSLNEEENKCAISVNSRATENWLPSYFFFYLIYFCQLPVKQELFIFSTVHTICVSLHDT